MKARSDNGLGKGPIFTETKLKITNNSQMQEFLLHLILEQNEFELLGSTYAQIFFFSSKYDNTLGSWFVESVDVEPQTERKYGYGGTAHMEG